MIGDKEKAYIQAFISANLDSIYKKTASLELARYLKLLNMIIKKRVETGLLTTTDFKNKTLKVKRKSLTQEELKALNWLKDNEEFLRKKIDLLLNRRKNK